MSERAIAAPAAAAALPTRADAGGSVPQVSGVGLTIPPHLRIPGLAETALIMWHEGEGGAPEHVQLCVMSELTPAAPAAGLVPAAGAGGARAGACAQGA